MRIPLMVMVSILPIISACQGPTPPAPPETPASFNTALSVKELMGWLIDPSAGAIWGATGSVVTAEGTQELAPTTDEQWNELRTNAVAVVESGNLLMLPARARDQGEWLKLSRGMTDKARSVLEAIEAKDVEGLFNAGGELYQSCTDCHALYLAPTQPAQ